MELLDPDEERNQLLRKSEQHRREMEGDVKMISENTQQIVTNALVIGGSLAMAYFLVRQFSGKPNKKKKHKQRKVKLVQAEAPEVVEVDEEPAAPGILGQVGAAIATQASVFLLGLAKEKLMEFMATLAEKKKEEQ